MGEFTTIERQGPVATVYFDRHEKLNALSVAAMRELTQVARSFEDDIDTSVIVLTGTEAFLSAGADLPPVAFCMSKQSIDMAAKALNSAVTFMDRDQFALASTSKDQQEAVSAFL